MPRRGTITGRVERLRRRQTMSLTRNVITNASNDDIDILDDSIKCALNLIPRNFQPFHCGSLDMRCLFCTSKNFKSEVTSGETLSFTLCCHKGNVVLPPFTQNRFFENIWNGLSSTDMSIKNRSKNYFQHIRSYNSSLALVSSEAKLSDTVLNGVYHFKIHDTFYHRAGALTPDYGRPPTYAQLYFYDVETANQFRMGITSNGGCKENLMRELTDELERVNVFVRSFRSMAEYCQHPENVAANVSIVIKVNQNADFRRFNDTVHTDVAVIFKTIDGEPPFEQNMLTFSKQTNTLRTVSVLDSSLDPLAYPLLFPNGDTGWHVNIVCHIATSTSSAASRNKITMLQYASYRLAIRDEFSLLHRSQKLFLQWVVDMYVRIEGARLHFIRQNQNTLRAEVYNNLTDFLHQHPNRANGIHSVGRKIILPSSFIGAPRNMFQNYLDAMSIVQHYGKPSLFVTMTCNPRWREISENLNGCAANFRPDIIVRVFKCKLKELIGAICKKNVFGMVNAIIYTIEFQKRGLPHAYMN